MLKPEGELFPLIPVLMFIGCVMLYRFTSPVSTFLLQNCANFKRPKYLQFLTLQLLGYFASRHLLGGGGR